MKSILDTIIHYLLKQWIITKPYMQNYKKFNNKKLINTRVSSTTYIGNKYFLDLGNNCYIGHFNVIDASNGVKIGNGCQFGSNVSIYSHSSHIAIRLYGEKYVQYHNQHIGYIKGKVDIGAYTFIGSYSLIEPNVTIGKGSLIKAFSHVKQGTYPDFAILEGIPAKIVGDTRQIDEKYLNQNQKLKEYYNEWQ
jgi:acetyltransferase-like isoleucine patch superfamily enzyme